MTKNMSPESDKENSPKRVRIVRVDNVKLGKVIEAMNENGVQIGEVLRIKNYIRKNSNIAYIRTGDQAYSAYTGKV